MFGFWKRTPLEKSIRRWTTDPTEQRRRDLCNEMARAQLYIATGAPPEAFLAGDGPHGPVLLVFTTEAELHRRSPTARPVLVTAPDVYALLGERGLRGIVINPAGRWVFLSTEDVGSQLHRDGGFPGQN
jgi:hypothetical protein